MNEEGNLVITGKRSYIDIIADLVKCAIGGIRKTKLLYSTNLNQPTLEKYLKIAIRSGLIAVEKRGSVLVFRTTGKGLEFLELYRRLRSLLTLQ
ncbi:MAG: hypothetical protein DRJ40_03640 [Thermoprotei archaeon]|nr:MAG: hypothetical protein DRJ40_03640 [Thermoprotei archaeon]